MEFKFYENSDGEKIDIKELFNYDNYYKVFVSKVTLDVKMKENYFKGKLHHIYYYMSHDENEKEIAKILSKTKNSFCIVYKSTIGTNTIENLVHYFDLKIRSKSSQLYNNNGQIICSQPIDLKTGKPNYLETEKHLFNPKDKEKYPYEEYIFEYNEEGTIESIRHVANHYWKGYEFYDFEIVNKRFDYTLNYYLTAEI